MTPRPSGWTRQLSAGRVALLLVAVAAVAIVVGTLTVGSDAGGRADVVDRGPIAPYLHRPGGQVVDVPDGRYVGGAVTASHDDWLVLRAETPGGVVVDLADTGLRLDATTRRIVFVGFKFVNGMVRLGGVDDIQFWYCDFTSPPAQWAAKYRAAGGTVPAARNQRTGLIAKLANPLPTGIRMTSTRTWTNHDIGIYGSDIHDVGDDGMFLADVGGLRVAGVRIWDVDEHGIDPGASFGNGGDWFHNDGIQTAGAIDDVEITDSWIGQKLQWGATGDDITNARFRRVWLAGSRTFGMINGVADGGRILANSMEDVRAFGNGQAHGGHDADTDAFRTDFVDGRQVAQWPRAYEAPGRFELSVRGVDLSVPSGIRIRDGVLVDVDQVRDHPRNPANVWRRAHPYDDFREFLHLP